MTPPRFPGAPTPFSARLNQLHETFGMDVSQPLTAQRLIRYAERLQEEMDEARDAWILLHLALQSQRDDDTIRTRSVELLKELMDVHYMCSALSVAFGWDEDEAFRRVHFSNMGKVWDDGKPRFREDGKILKPPTYRTPELEDLV